MSTVYLAPASQGAGDGSSEANADSYNNINDYVGPGVRIVLIDSAGAYHRTNTGPSITAGGTPGSPCVIGGAGPGSRAVFTSTREDPWLGGDEGDIIFQLGAGASHLTWKHFDLSNLKQGWQVGAPVASLKFQDIVYDNVRFVIENRIVAGQTDATISGFTAMGVKGTRHSKRTIELDYDSHDILISTNTGDSEQTDGDPIAMGVHFAGTVHDVLVVNTAIHNHYHDAAAYWNGDSYSSEDGTYRFTFIDCDGYGNTDAGWDLKTDGVRLLRCRASDSKRNFRFWGTDVELVNCVSHFPNLRGGTGTQAHVHTTDDGEVTIRNMLIIDHDAATIVFDADGTSSVTVVSADVTRHTDSDLTTVETGASVDTSGVTDNLVDSGSEPVPAAPLGGVLSPWAGEAATPRYVAPASPTNRASVLLLGN